MKAFSMSTARNLLPLGLLHNRWMAAGVANQGGREPGKVSFSLPKK